MININLNFTSLNGYIEEITRKILKIKDEGSKGKFIEKSKFEEDDLNYNSSPEMLDRIKILKDDDIMKRFDRIVTQGEINTHSKKYILKKREK